MTFPLLCTQPKQEMIINDGDHKCALKRVIAMHYAHYVNMDVVAKNTLSLLLLYNYSFTTM